MALNSDMLRSHTNSHFATDKAVQQHQLAVHVVQLGDALHLSRNPGRHLLRDKDDYLACSVCRVRILAEHRPKRGGELKRYQVSLEATYSRCMLESGSWMDRG